MTDDIVKKEYEEIEYDGSPARLYPNGVIRSPKGYILEMPSDVMREIRRKRTIIAEERAREGLMLGTQSNTPEDAVMKIIREKAIVAMNDHTRAGTDAAKFVLEQAGYRVNDERTVDVKIQHKQTYEIDEETRALLESITQMKRDGNRKVIDGTVSDVAKDTLKREGIE